MTSKMELFESKKKGIMQLISKMFPSWSNQLPKFKCSSSLMVQDIINLRQPTKVRIKSPCTASTTLLALIEVHGLLIQTLYSIFL